jgi:ribosomal protein L11 methyltransferase
MDYIELTAAVPAAAAERTADILRTIGDGGAWIEHDFTQRDLESDADLARDGAALVRVYLRGEEAESNASLARAALTSADIDARVGTRRVSEEDWAEAWKEHFDIERYGERLVVVPSWRQFEAAPDDIALTLDPGMAFGTGQHETTRMCLEALERTVRSGMRILDVGSGSGILSIAAARLGASEVRALDIDDDCVRITRENARANGVGDVVRTGIGTAGERWPFREPAEGRFDLVVANIVASVIIDLAPYLASALRNGGILIASGIIGEREREVGAALSKVGFRIATCRAMGDWRCVEAARA